MLANEDASSIQDKVQTLDPTTVVLTRIFEPGAIVLAGELYVFYKLLIPKDFLICLLN